MNREEERALAINLVPESETIIYRGWTISKTPCFPCCWKIEKIGYKTDNWTWRYHKTIKDAKDTIDIKNRYNP